MYLTVFGCLNREDEEILGVFSGWGTVHEKRKTRNNAN